MVYLRTEFSLVKRILVKKIRVAAQELKERLKEIHQKGYLDYLDGSLDSIKFLKPREDELFLGNGGIFFEQIQKINCRNGKK